MIAIPERLVSLARSCPFPLYLVGGTVRDALAGLCCGEKDYDICAPASAEEFISAALKQGAVIKAVYKNTGTVKFTLGDFSCEYASFRSDEYVRGGHVPVNTFFTDDIVLDARRRDFRCNAVYYNIAEEGIADPLDGVNDILHGALNTVAPADKVFGEDGLRLMRLARQAAQTGFAPSAECIEGAKKNAALISDIVPQRIFGELELLLMADGKYGISRGQLHGLRILDETGVIDFVLPELAAGRGLFQRADYHFYDVLEHSFRAAAYAEKGVRWAALLHDIAKPRCMAQNGNFYNHEQLGEIIAGEALERLSAPKRLTERVRRLISLHMYDYNCLARESKVRRFIVCNYDCIDDLLKLKQADFSACKDSAEIAPTVLKWQSILQKMRGEGVPFTLKQLAVKGDALIRAGVEKKNCAEILKALLAECAVNPAMNTAEKLTSRALILQRDMCG